MSHSDALAPDSDPDSDIEAKVARIEKMATDYRNGKNLLIVSAVLKGEVKTNPWARKRKRSPPESTLGTIFGVKKIIQCTASQKQNEISQPVASKIASAQINSICSNADRITPYWDQTSPVNLTGLRKSKPTARVINFREYESQALGELVRRRSPAFEECDDRHANLEPVVDPKLQTPGGTRTNASTSQAEPGHECQNPTDSDSGTAFVAQLTSPQDPFTRSRTSDLSHGPRKDLTDGSEIAFEAISSPDINGIILSPIQHINTDLPAPRTPVIANTTSFDTSIESSRDQGGSNEGRSATNIIAQQTVLQLPFDHISTSSPRRDAVESDSPRPIDDPILNTQAELIHAQEGLADAFTFRNELEHIPEQQSIESRSTMMQVNRSNLKSPQRFTESLEHCIQSDREDPHLSLELAENQGDSAGMKSLSSSHTPRNKPLQGAPSFALFQSPVGTQESYLDFASPLTFSPARPVSRSGRHRAGRHDDTIDDIQKYLNDSNWTAEEEARRLMES